MKKLRFQIRSWNRAKKLEICIRRIAEEVVKIGKQDECVIFVIDNHSSDETPKVLKKLKKEIPFLLTYRYPKWCTVEEVLPIPEEILKKVEAEFVWLWGDDDILLHDTLPIVWKVLTSEEAKNCAIIHAGHGWLKPHSYKVYHGTVIEFCNLMGFAQFIGWLTSIIFGKSLIEKFINNLAELEILNDLCPYTSNFLKTAFPHVLFSLYFSAYEPAIVIDYPIAEPMEPQKAEDAERWEKENIGWRYFLFAKEVKRLYDIGIFKEKLKPRFFKYHSFYLWDRFLSEMIASRLGLYTRNPRRDEGWQIILDMADMIDDQGVAKQIRTSVYLAKGLTREYQHLKKLLEKLPQEEVTIRKELEDRLKEVEKNLFLTYQEVIKPIFKVGWAGEGIQLTSSIKNCLYNSSSIIS